MRRAQELELGLAPRPAGTTLQRWLYDELRAAILSGRIAAGRRLPSSRDLARQQGVSRGTVLSVYEQLMAEGYLASTTGSGTVVVDALRLQGAPARPVVPALPGGRHLSPPSPPSPLSRLSRQGRRLADSPFPLYESSLTAVPFRPNQPDLAAFPWAVWNKLSHRCNRQARPDAMAYGEAAGYRPLRQAIAEHLRYAQRIDCRAEQVMILGSAQQAMDLCIRLLLDPGQAALVEDPGYPGAARLVELAGGRVIDVPVDGAGLCTSPPLPVASDIRLAYVTAAHQSPLGGALPLERRLDLLAWAEACDATIIEDDYDSEFRFDAAPLSSLMSLDGAGRVIYMGTFSKLLFPALRLAYVVLPEWLAEPCAAAISLTCRHLPVAPQAVLAAFIAEGHFARHLRQMRLRYGERAAVFQTECRRQLGGLLTVLPITTGMDAAALLDFPGDDRTVAAALAQGGVEARPLSFYRRSQPGPPGLVLGFSAFAPAQLCQGVAAMAPILEACRAAGAG
ncbi:transcriptional regulator [Azospira sp. I13]|uniref:MocR-like pyridoxine biosynthesis transcription factor PdxR n=1 Tax=Azospira sp. I13 TaxID=1765050 RepID=UPI000D4CA9BC|nr:PLP-dependent aminotransferase family protein [Azospira sp. I13]GBG03061.1 transcriptional regulator [Azospira sp. I13]